MNPPIPDDPLGARLYEIRLEGHLDDHWSDWFAGLKLTHEPQGVTLLSGAVLDQSALHALLRKVRDLGVPLLSVIQVNAEQVDLSDTDT